MRDPALEILVEEYLDGTIDSTGRRRLEEIVRSDPSAREGWTDQIQMHHRLGVLLGPAPPLADSVLREIRLLPDAPRFSHEVVARLKREAARAGRWGRLGLAAAGVAFAAVWLLVLRAGPAGPAAPGRGPALLLAGGLPLGEGDARVRERLERLGFPVEARVVGGFDPVEARGKVVVLVSSTTYALGAISAPDRPVRELREADVPLIVWEPLLFHELGMIPGSVHKADWAANRASAHIRIADPAHPLAAGLSGRVRVMDSPRPLSWGRPRADAARVAVLEDDPDRAVLFAYDRGAEMPGGRAPARRVGFFLFDDTAGALTPEGWRLFDAAVRWCTGVGER